MMGGRPAATSGLQAAFLPADVKGCRRFDSSLQAINAGLEPLKSGSGTLGKIAVTVDPDLGR